MNRKTLEDLGLEKEAIDKIMEANNVDIEREKRKVEKAVADKDGAESAQASLQTQLDDVQAKLMAFDNVDVSDMKSQIETLTSGLEAAKTDHLAEIEKLRRAGENKDFFTGLTTPFINDETRTYYADKLEAALDSGQNRGKSRQEILDALTAGEDGKPRPGIYKEPESPNKLDIPPAGDVGETQTKPRELPTLF